MRSLLIAVASGLGLWALFVFIPGMTKAPEGDPPDVVGVGQHLAVRTLKDAHWGVSSHDAYGRNRSGDDRLWVVCFQSKPDPSDVVTLAVAVIREGCPPYPHVDQGTVAAVKIGDAMPDLSHPYPLTAYMVTRDFPNASIRFQEGPHWIRKDFADYKVCAQSTEAGTIWTGEPLLLAVQPYTKSC